MSDEAKPMDPKELEKWLKGEVRFSAPRSSLRVIGQLLATITERDKYIVVLRENEEQWKKIAQEEKQKGEKALESFEKVAKDLLRAQKSLMTAQSKAQVAEDLHEALGVKWGDDPYPRINALKKAEERLETAENIIDRLVKFAVLGDIPGNKSSTMEMVQEFIKKKEKDG